MRVTWTCFDVSGLILTNIYSMSLRSFKGLRPTDWLRVGAILNAQRFKYTQEQSFAKRFNLCA